MDTNAIENGLDPKGVAEFIFSKIGRRVPMPTIYRWLIKGVISAKKLGGSWIVKPSEVDIFLLGNRKKNKQSTAKRRGHK